MKNVVFLIDKTKKDEVANLLTENGIKFNYNSRFYFDVNTAVVTVIGIVVLIIVFASIF